jgi:hypothetical protein
VCDQVGICAVFPKPLKMALLVEQIASLRKINRCMGDGVTCLFVKPF